jgi:hypothetical protein
MESPCSLRFGSQHAHHDKCPIMRANGQMEPSRPTVAFMLLRRAAHLDRWADEHELERC